MTGPLPRPNGATMDPLAGVLQGTGFLTPAGPQ